jgi:hypothetical protein
MTRSASCFFFIMIVTCHSANLFAQRNNNTVLFNGRNLDGWDTYIGPPLDDAGKKLNTIAVGLNNDQSMFLQ